MMGILDKIYLNKYEDLKKKIYNLNMKNVKGYETFQEYVLSNEIMISYYEELKKLEKKYSKLHVDDYNTFENQISGAMKRIYNRMLIEIFELEDEEQRIEQLKRLKEDISGCYGHKVDKNIDSLIEDIEEKITNADRYIVKSIDKNVEQDSLLEQAIELVIDMGQASASMLQRRFRIGYSEAGRIIDQMEEIGVVSSYEGSKPRQVLITKEMWDAQKNINGKKLTLISNEEYEDILVDKIRKKQTIKDIMREYNIDVNYEETMDWENLKNSLVINCDNENETSNLLNTLLKYNSPDRMNLVLFDTNKLTFKEYSRLPHLQIPIITDIKKMVGALDWLTYEMQSRYNKFLNSKVKSYEQFIDKVGEMPCIVLIIDEVFELLNDKDAYECLVKLLLNGTRVGIRIMLFSKFSKKNLNLGSIEDLLEVCDKYIVSKIPDLQDVQAKENISIIDENMNGLDFEKYAGVLLEQNGFEKIKVTQASGDFGVDIIAYKDDIKYAIQCKKYSSPVGVKAVQEVIASKAMEDCHVAVVLTNNTFTKSAKQLAQKNNVLLWDRNKLAEMIEKKK